MDFKNNEIIMNLNLINQQNLIKEFYEIYDSNLNTENKYLKLYEITIYLGNTGFSNEKIKNVLNEIKNDELSYGDKIEKLKSCI